MTKPKRQWQRHERLIRTGIIAWIRRGRPGTLRSLAWNLANEEACQFDLLEFNDNLQRVYLQRGVVEWIEQLVRESEAAVKKQAEWERFSG